METQTAKFNIGQVVATPGASTALEETGEGAKTFLDRHVRGDWGEMTQADSDGNDRAIAHEGDREKQGRVMSSYKLSSGVKVCILTEWDRSVTTLMLWSEY